MSNKNVQNKTKKNDTGPKYHRCNEKLKTYVILKQYQLPKDPDHEGFRLMPSGMRKQLSEIEFKEYGNITIFNDDKNTTKKTLPKDKNFIQIEKIGDALKTLSPLKIKFFKKKGKITIKENIDPELQNTINTVINPISNSIKTSDIKNVIKIL